jgi:5-oxoprolinase (ATP-hydrolysing) subunit A
MTMDLNCDLGELEDAAHEAALMEHITSANIACGAHAGNEAVMERTARLALARGIRMGAHPGYPDGANFGRVEIALTPGEIADTVFEQICRLEAVVSRLGGTVAYVKPHGALYNVAVRNAEVAGAIGNGIKRWRSAATVFGLADSPMLEVWRHMGLDPWGEAFADRRYEADGTLRLRKLEGALITEPAEAAAQALLLAARPSTRTICVHSDTPGAQAIVAACRVALRRA